MLKQRPTAVFTQEFGAEFEVERQAWLRRRFLWYCGFVLATTVLMGGFGVMAMAWSGDPTASRGTTLAVTVLGLLVTVGLYGWAFVFVRRKRNGPAWPPNRIAFWLIVISGLFTLVTTPVFTNPMAAEVVSARESVGPGGRAGAAEASGAEGTASGTEGTASGAEGAAAGEKAEVEGAAEASAGGNERSAESALARKRRAAIEIALGGLGAVYSIFLTHFLACLFLPWTPEESFKPLAPLAMATAVIMAGFTVRAYVIGAGGPTLLLAGLVVVLASLLCGFPGAAVCWWRHTRFRERFTAATLRGRYAELRQELTNARQIHESLFPKPASAGGLTFRYVYEPMRQIGGDYLYARFDEAGSDGSAERPFNLVLIDVTGHGIPAALTVNRLHGELDRIFAEHPGCTPGRLLALLNSYVHLTLSNHSVFATALCVRVDPGGGSGRGTLEFASGGHPPAFVRGADGTIEQLECTSYVLGASPPGEFAPDSRVVDFGPGDTFIAYTDGAMESRDQAGRYLGVRGIQRLIATGEPDAGEGWPRTILRGVDQYRFGPIADDTLVVEISRAATGAGVERGVRERAGARAR